MAVEKNTQNYIPFEDCWQVPVQRLTGIPVRYHVESIDGRLVQLANQRPFGSSVLANRYRHPQNQRERRRTRLMNVFRNGGIGHYAEFEGLHLLADATERDREMNRQLDQLQADAENEKKLFAAFVHPENPDSNHLTLALARVAGVLLDETRNTPAIGLIVAGKSVLEGKKTGEPAPIPLEYNIQAWPYLVVD